MKEQEKQAVQVKFGKQIKKIMKEKGLSYRDAAANCSLTHSRIQEIATGKYNVRLYTILEVAKGLDVTPSKLMDY